MRYFWVLLCASLVLCGCATKSTIETRKKERPAAYAGLPEVTRASVDQGQIKVGMSEDAVYIAWGKPSQILHSENEGGASTVWVYEGGWMEETRYWGRRHIWYDYQPRTYVRAEVIFVSGVVKEWRTLPQPVY